MASGETNSSIEAPTLNVIKEGKAEVYYPNHVFYNPVQEFNRDLTIAVITQYSKLLDKEREIKKQKALDNALKRSQHKVKPDEVKVESADNTTDDTKNLPVDSGQNSNTTQKRDDEGLVILEGLAASGLRSVRFGLEIPGVREITTNDFDKGAYELIKRNVTKNGLEHIVTPNYGDAAMVMYQNKKKFHVIDLDPYGSPALFLDSAVQSIQDGGLLCITCTDTAVLCGRASETCMAKYGAVSIPAKFCHEMALRITLHCVQSHASRYSRYIVPLISVSVDFYVRVFVRVFTGQAKVKNVLSKLAMVYNCTGCGSHHLQDLGTKTPTKGDQFKYGNAIGPKIPQKCAECNGSFHVGGPVWKDRINDLDFVKNVEEYVSGNKDRFKTADRIVGMLSVVQEELPDVPFYYVTDQLCGTLHCNTPNLLQLRSAILHSGHQVSMSHCMKNSVKTTAPPSVIWDIMRCWVKLNPISEKHKKDGTPLKSILSKEPTIQACFDVRDDANPKSRQKGLLRWQQNPEPEWGPKMRATRNENKETQMGKQLRLQNKRMKKSGEGKKQSLCKKYKSGRCDQGDECSYSHKLDKESAMDCC